MITILHLTGFNGALTDMAFQGKSAPILVICQQYFSILSQIMPDERASRGMQWFSWRQKGGCWRGNREGNFPFFKMTVSALVSDCYFMGCDEIYDLLTEFSS
jgi:hypothetical protein